MSRLTRLAQMVRYPSLAVGKLRSIATRFNVAYYRRFGDIEPTDVVAEDWDNLLICDACRYDMFAARYLPGNLQERISAGSHSWEFMQHNFVDRQLHDTVYVTANPHTYWLDEDVFHAVVNLVETGWNDEYGTVMPETVAEAAVNAHEKYPDKRLIVHFMQPHYPFVGDAGQTLNHGGMDRDSVAAHENANLEAAVAEEATTETSTETTEPDPGGPDDIGGHPTTSGTTESSGMSEPAESPWLDPATTDVWTLVQYSRIDRDEAVEAYGENLDAVLPYVTDLLDALSGKSVVTADHGNLIGDRMRPVPTRGYGHPSGLFVHQLVRVPWLVVPSEQRRTVTSDPSVERTDLDSDVVEERLKKLGYAD